MIGAADCPFDGFRFMHQLHAPMAADILKHPQRAVLVANEQQGHAEKLNRFCITRVWHIRTNRKPGPSGLEHRFAFFGKHSWINIMGIGQPGGLLYRLLNRGDVGLYVIFSHSALHFPWSYARIARETFPDATKTPPLRRLHVDF